MTIISIRRSVAVWIGVALWATASLSANAAIDLALDGIGYIMPNLVGSHMTVTELNNMIKVYNGTAASPINGETYTIDRGTLTPAKPLSLAPTIGSIITPTSADGYGKPTATVHLGTGGYAYLTAQWDGPNGANAVYYIGGLKGDITIVNDLPGFFNGNHPMDQLGLSGYELSVPEPTTMIAGALLLLPFGASTVRIVRRNRSGSGSSQWPKSD